MTSGGERESGGLTGGPVRVPVCCAAGQGSPAWLLARSNAKEWAAVRGPPQTWTATRHDGPNHLELRCDALPEQQMPLITSDWPNNRRGPTPGPSRSTGTVSPRRLPSPPSLTHTRPHATTRDHTHTHTDGHTPTLLAPALECGGLSVFRFPRPQPG